MAFEVACSQCQGRLMVEQAGVIVACPHCGAHLNIEAPADADAPLETESPPDVNAPPQDVEAMTSQEEPAAESVPDSEPSPEASDSTPSNSPEADQPAKLESQDVVSTDESPAEQQVLSPDNPALDSKDTIPEMPVVTMEFPDAVAEAIPPSPTIEPEPAADTPSATDAPPVTDVPPAIEPPSAADSSPASDFTTTPEHTPNTPSSNDTNAVVTSAAGGRGVSHQTFSLLRSYAIAMTLAVIFLVYKLLNPNMSALESLPDVKPPKKDDKIVYKLVPEATEMPPGHLLSLGQSQRFGNLKVTPVRVTKEPVEFVHHLGEAGVVRDPGGDVVKLWLKFENLSSDQQIAPLDGLVFKRDDNDFENIRSNNFVCRKSEKKKGGELVFVYDLNEFDIWNLRNQNVELEIAPGESLETYVPTGEDGLAHLLNSDEPLIWRVQFRKGYSPKNYGVTTVIEVAFESSDIGVVPIASEPDEAKTEDAA